MYSFFNKKEKNFTTHMEILEKISNIFKKTFNGKLIYRKKYLKDDKK